MTTRTHLIMFALLAAAPIAVAQSSSIGKQQDARNTAAQTGKVEGASPTAGADVAGVRQAEEAAKLGNPVIDSNSMIAVKLGEPRKFKINDLITIIVREQVQYEAEGTSNARRQGELTSELEAFINIVDGGVGAAQFRRGAPNLDYKSSFNQRNDADQDREDRFTTRITGTIIDVKPNGNLVFEARHRMQHDQELAVMTLTGTFRSEDVTPDNTVLSTQIANLDLEKHTEGQIRDATKPGWAGTLFDWIRPL